MCIRESTGKKLGYGSEISEGSIVLKEESKGLIKRSQFRTGIQVPASVDASAEIAPIRC